MRLQILSMALAATALSPAASAQTVADYLSRIAAVDDSGPKLDAVLAISPDAAKEEAAAKAIKLSLIHISSPRD